MGESGHNANHPETPDGPLPIAIDIRQLQPLEIVLIRRYAHRMPHDGFPAFDRFVDEFEQQLRDLPRTDLSFAREVYGAFALSPYPIDRLNIGLMLRPLTLADHAAGFALWHQLVRDEHADVRRDVYQPIHHHLMSTKQAAEIGLAQEGLTLADADQLRDAFIGAQYLGGCHVISQTAVTEALQEVTHSLDSIARV